MFIILQLTFGNEKKKERITIRLNQYLQYLYKIRFSQTFAKVESQRKALQDSIVETN